VLPFGSRDIALQHQRTDHGRVEIKTKAQERPFWARIQNLADDRDVDRDHQIMRFVVDVDAFPGHGLLPALRDEANGGLVNCM
jgi:hypothetical protein